MVGIRITTGNTEIQNNHPLFTSPSIALPSLEASRGHLGIAHRGLNIPMPQEGLQGSSILALVGIEIADGMPELVWMHSEWHAGAFPKATHHLPKPCRGDGSAAFADEYMGAGGILSL